MRISKEELQAIIDTEINTAVKKYGKEFKQTLIRILSLEKMLNPEKNEKKSRLIELSKWNKFHPYPTVGALRQYKFYNTDNFEEVLEFGGINGGRVLINEDKLFEWLENRKKKKLKLQEEF